MLTPRTRTRCRAIVTAEKALLLEPNGQATAKEYSQRFLDILLPRVQSTAGGRTAVSQAPAPGTPEYVRALLDGGRNGEQAARAPPYELEVLEAALIVATGGCAAAVLLLLLLLLLLQLRAGRSLVTVTTSMWGFDYHMPGIGCCMRQPWHHELADGQDTVQHSIWQEWCTEQAPVLFCPAGRFDVEVLTVTRRVSQLLTKLPREITPVNLEELRRIKSTLVELEDRAEAVRGAWHMRHMLHVLRHMVHMLRHMQPHLHLHLLLQHNLHLNLNLHLHHHWHTARHVAAGAWCSLAHPSPLLHLLPLQVVKMLEELLDDEDELRELNLSSRPRREMRREQRERARLERELERWGAEVEVWW
jgi:hypothetical protein